jgi:hypothetical protein
MIRMASRHFEFLIIPEYIREKRLESFFRFVKTPRLLSIRHSSVLRNSPDFRPRGRWSAPHNLLIPNAPFG